MKRVLQTAPTVEPISVTEAKEHMRISYDYEDDDNYIDSLIRVVRESTEQFLKRKLITQTWKIYLNHWPYGDSIILPYGKVQSVTHVKYTNTAGTQSTWSTDYYNVDTYSDPGRIVLEYGYFWPVVTLLPQNPIEIQFVTGYGDVTAIPTPIIQAMLIKIADLYEQRESFIVGMSIEKMHNVNPLLTPYKVWELASDECEREI